MKAAIGLLCFALVGCAARRLPEEEIQDGLPPWKTNGEEVRLKIAEDFLDSGNTIGALQIIRQMRAEGFKSGELDLMQGRAMLKDGVVTEAERMLLAARKSMPRDDRAYAELCVLYAEEQQIEKAIEMCERATELNRDNARAWNNLSFLLLAQDEAEEAGFAAEEAVRLDGAEPLYRNNLALTLVARGRADQAFRTFRSTMSRPEAAYMTGLAVERFDGTAKARTWYVRALEGNPKHTGALEKLKPVNDDPDGASQEEP